MRRVALVLLAACCQAALAADPPAKVTSVTPERAGDLVVCRLRTEGLPGQKLLQSMQSGLISAVELEVAVVDDREQVVAGNHISLQLGFDLWEEIFSVRGDGAERRFTNLADLESYLQELGDVPVAPVSRLDPEARYRLHIGLQVHPIAPAEQDRVENVIVGERSSRREGSDEQEAQVSMGRLIRLFFKGGDKGGAHQSVSAWFTRKELDDAAH
ncbi:MAG: DUF4390 domain-containing protein [bacterium]|nr:DUF4390 domain-containing protein [bacterium]